MLSGDIARPSLRSFCMQVYVTNCCVGRLLTQVHETHGGCGMVDTGHCRPTDTSLVQLPPSQSSHLPTHVTVPTRRQRAVSGFSESCPPDKRVTVTPGRSLNVSGTHSVDVSHVNDTVSYVMEVKRALVSQPLVYRQFVAIVQRCHDQRRSNTFQLDLQSIRQIVSLLRTQPQLVLNFNEFLPDGYRIRMIDRSRYVIEYPDAVAGIARLTIAV